MSDLGDVIDRANDRAMNDERLAEAMIRKAAAQIRPGEAGVCTMCDEWSPRLVRGVCAPCRDLHNLP